MKGRISTRMGSANKGLLSDAASRIGRNVCRAQENRCVPPPPARKRLELPPPKKKYGRTGSLSHSMHVPEPWLWHPLCPPCAACVAPQTTARK